MTLKPQPTECSRCHEELPFVDIFFGTQTYVSGEPWCLQCIDHAAKACVICKELSDDSKILEVIHNRDSYFVCESDLLVFALDQRFNRILGAAREVVR
jgi:hypothetical protein